MSTFDYQQGRRAFFKEIIFALNGVEGDLFYMQNDDDNKTQFQIDSKIAHFISEPNIKLLEKLCAIANSYKNIKDFIRVNKTGINLIYLISFKQAILLMIKVHVNINEHL